MTYFRLACGVCVELSYDKYCVVDGDILRKQRETILRVQKTSVVLLSKNNIERGIEICYFHIIKCTQLTKCTLLL